MSLIAIGKQAPRSNLQAESKQPGQLKQETDTTLPMFRTECSMTGEQEWSQQKSLQLIQKALAIRYPKCRTWLTEHAIAV